MGSDSSALAGDGLSAPGTAHRVHDVASRLSGGLPAMPVAGVGFGTGALAPEVVPHLHGALPGLLPSTRTEEKSDAEHQPRRDAKPEEPHGVSRVPRVAGSVRSRSQASRRPNHSA